MKTPRNIRRSKHVQIMSIHMIRSHQRTAKKKVPNELWLQMSE
jgi:hypothetical protein